MELWHILQIIVLAMVQGAAELLPISSSAHVTVAAKLMCYDMGQIYEWTFLLVMLHTGTMFSVLIYFRSRWKSLLNQIPALIGATACTGVVGYPLMLLLKKILNSGSEQAQPQEIEHLFLNLPLMACSLAAVGVLIVVAGRKDEKTPGTETDFSLGTAAVIGAVQGLALPFRGFSRSGSTISAGMLMGIVRTRAEEFSFALAVILTPVVVAREVLMLIKQHGVSASAAEQAVPTSLAPLFLPGLLGMFFSFIAGLVALAWLSKWLEQGRWKCFGYYCVVAAVAVLVIRFLSAKPPT
jgi:undecaprenyl-diphosphatase